MGRMSTAHGDVDEMQPALQQLAGHSEPLLNSISSHNDRWQPQFERGEILPIAYMYLQTTVANFGHAVWFLGNALSRLMVETNRLASYVRSFTWTFIWLNFDLNRLTSTDYQTWNVCKRMINVTHLDLSSLDRAEYHDYIR